MNEEISTEVGTEYKIGTFAWTPVTGTTINTKYISDKTAATVQIRKVAGESTFVSAIETVSVPKRAAAPTTVKYDGNSDSIIGVSPTMQYTIDDDGKPNDDWQDIAISSISRAMLQTFDWEGKEPTTAYVRVKANEGTKTPASHWVALEIPADPETPILGSLDGILTIDYELEQIKINTGEEPRPLEYSQTDSAPWVALTDGYSISSLIPAYTEESTAATIYVRIAAVAPNIASASAEFEIAARPAAPTSLVFDMKEETIKTVGDTHDYAVGTGAYTKYDEDEDDAFKLAIAPGTAAKTVYIRVAAVEEVSFASAPLAVSVPKRPAAPSLTYNAASDSVTIKKNVSYEYGVLGEETVADLVFEELGVDPTSTVATRTELGLDEDGGTVYVRLAATSTDPASLARDITFPQGTGELDSVSLNYKAETLDGAQKNTMEYRKSSSYSSTKKEFTYPTSWTKVSADDMSISSMIPAAGASASVSVQIRIKASGDIAVSEPQTFELKPRPAAPVKGTHVVFNGIEESIELVDDKDIKGYQYLDSVSGDYAEIEWAEYESPEVGDTATSVKIRFAPVDDLFASLPVTISVPARPAKPNVTYSGTTDSVTGLSTSTMEYSYADTEESWKSPKLPTKSTMKQSDFAGNEGVVYIRKKATETAPSSQIVVITFATAGGAPNTETVKLNLETEKIEGTETTMEYSYDAGANWTTASKNETNVTSVLSKEIKDNKLLVRYKANAGALASTPAELAVNARPATPTASQVKYDFVNEKIVITGYDDETLEFSIDGGTSYEELTNGTVVELSTTAATSIKVRVKYSGTTPASLARTISVPKRAAAPSAAWDTAKSRIKSVTSAMEYSIDAGATWISVLSGQTYIEGLDEGTVLVRVKATTSAVHSVEKPVEVLATT